MKKTALLLIFCAFVNCINAQLQNGSFAPDFSLYEIDKDNGQILTDHVYTLTEYTNAGKAVYLDFFATNCNPCWNYHQNRTFEDLYTQYGPNGTNEIMAFGIEASAGNYASLSGTGNDNNGFHTYGNWLDGVPYPMIPLAMSPNTHTVANEYQISFFPTICIVCPNRNVYSLGQIPLASLYAAKNQYCSEPEFAANARAVKLSGIETTYYCDANLAPVVKIQNIGSAAMTSLQLEINHDGQTSTVDWTGDVAMYQDIDITLPEVSETTEGNHSYTVTVKKVNGIDNANATQHAKTKEFQYFMNSITTIDEKFTTDNFKDTWYSSNNLVEWDNQQHAIFFGCMDIMKGSKDEVYLPILNLSGLNYPTLQFDVAHARYDGTSVDTLEVYVSSDCGNNWTRIFYKVDPELATADNQTYPFMPIQSSHWRTETVDMTAYKSNEMLVKFVFTSGFGNSIWIDNVKTIEGSGINEHDNEFSIYPNPANSILNITSNTPVEKVEIFNMQGQLVGMENGNVQNINIEGLISGSYILRISTENGVLNQMFVKE